MQKDFKSKFMTKDFENSKITNHVYTANKSINLYIVMV